MNRILTWQRRALVVCAMILAIQGTACWRKTKLRKRKPRKLTR